ncbi:MAG TPA: hypothetical protein PLF22_08465 [Pseudomonadales bacterium]|nr:hypothetical protein [Pseudomonadales bacterium]
MVNCTAPARITSLVFCLLVALTVQADDKDVKLYPLHHQTGATLLPTLNALMQPGESINEYNNQLVVNASPATQAQIEKLLPALDQPSRNLLISVRNNSQGDSSSDNSGVSGGIRSGQVYLGSNGRMTSTRGSQGGLVVQGNGVRVQTNREVRQSSSQSAQQIRAVEGYPAFISTGQSAAYNSRDAYGNRSTTFANAERGVYVTARIIGDRVQLEISTSNDKFSNTRRGVIDTQQLHTSTSGNIGEWISLGSISSQSSESRNGYTSQGDSSGGSFSDISVSVVPLD